MGCGSSSSAKIISASDFSPSATKNPTAITRRQSQIQLQKRASKSSLTTRPKSRKTDDRPRQSKPLDPPEEKRQGEAIQTTSSRGDSHSKHASKPRSRSSSASSRKSKHSSASGTAGVVVGATLTQTDIAHPQGEIPSNTAEKSNDELDGGMMSTIQQIGDTSEIEGQPVCKASTATEQAKSSASAAENTAVVPVPEDLDPKDGTADAAPMQSESQPPTAEDQQNHSEDTAASASIDQPSEVMPPPPQEREKPNPALKLGPAVALDTSRSTHTMGGKQTTDKQATRSSHAVISPETTCSKPSAATQDTTSAAVTAVAALTVDDDEIGVGDESTMAVSTTNLDQDSKVAPAEPPTSESAPKRSPVALGAPQQLEATQSTRLTSPEKLAGNRSTRSGHAIVDLSKNARTEQKPSESPTEAQSVEPNEDAALATMVVEQTKAPPPLFKAALGAPEQLVATQSTRHASAEKLSGSRSTRSGHAIVDVTRCAASGQKQSESSTHIQTAAPNVATSEHIVGEEKATDPAPGFKATLGTPEQLAATQSTRHISAEKLSGSRSTRSGHAIVDLSKSMAPDRNSCKSSTEDQTASPSADTAEPTVAEEKATEPAPLFKATLGAPEQLAATQSTQNVSAEKLSGGRSTQSGHALVDFTKNPGSVDPAAKSSDTAQGAELAVVSVDEPQSSTAQGAELAVVSVDEPQSSTVPSNKFTPSLGAPEQLTGTRSAVHVIAQPSTGDRSTQSSHALVDMSSTTKKQAASSSSMNDSQSQEQPAKEGSTEAEETVANVHSTEIAAPSIKLAPAEKLDSSRSTAAMGSQEASAANRGTVSSVAIIDSSKVAPPSTSVEQTEAEPVKAEETPAEPVGTATLNLGPAETLLASRSAVVMQHAQSPLAGDRSTASSSAFLDTTPGKSGRSLAAEPALSKSTDPLPVDGEAAPYSGNTEPAEDVSATPSPSQPEQDSTTGKVHIGKHLGPAEDLHASQSTRVVGLSSTADKRSTQSGHAALSEVKTGAPSTAAAQGETAAPPEVSGTAESCADEPAHESTPPGGSESTACSSGSKPVSSSRQLDPPEILLSSQSTAQTPKAGLSGSDPHSRSSGPAFSSMPSPSNVETAGVAPVAACTNTEQPPPEAGVTSSATRELDSPEVLLSSTSTVQVKGKAPLVDDRLTKSSVAAVDVLTKPSRTDETTANEITSTEAPVESARTQPPEDSPAGESIPPVAVVTQDEPTQAPSGPDGTSTAESVATAFIPSLDPPQSLLASTSSTHTAIPKTTAAQLQSTSAQALSAVPPQLVSSIPMIAVQAPSACSSRQDLRMNKQEQSPPAPQAADEARHETVSAASDDKPAPVEQTGNSDAEPVAPVEASQCQVEDNASTPAVACDEPVTEGTSPSTAEVPETAEQPQEAAPTVSMPLISKSSAALLKQIALEAQQCALQSKSASRTGMVDPEQAATTLAKHRTTAAKQCEEPGTKSPSVAGEETSSPKAAAPASTDEKTATVTQTVEAQSSATDISWLGNHTSPSNAADEIKSEEPQQQEDCPKVEDTAVAPSEGSEAGEKPDIAITSRSADNFPEQPPADSEACKPIAEPQVATPTKASKDKDEDNASKPLVSTSSTAINADKKPKKSRVGELQTAEVKIASKSMSAMAKSTGEDSDDEGKPMDLKEAAIVGGSASNISKAAAMGQPLKTASKKRSSSKGSLRSTGSKSSLRSASKPSVTASQHSLRSKSKTAVS